MNWKKFACGLGVLALLASGCGDDDGVDPGTDAGMGGTDGGQAGELCSSGACETYFFAASTIDVGKADPAGDPTVVPGFNLDDVVSTPDDPAAYEAGCQHMDFTSPPPDNEVGVDNQLGPIAGSIESMFDISGAIVENIANGNLLILMKLENVDDAMNDPRVTLSMYVGALPAGVDAPMLDGSGALSAGQTFDVGNGGAALATVEGSIVNGRLNAGPIDLELAFTVMDVNITLNIRSAQLRGTIGAGGASISSGIIGGSLDVDEAVETLSMAAPDILTPMTVMNILNTQADLARDAEGFCTAVSVGIVFTGVDATEGAAAP